MREIVPGFQMSPAGAEALFSEPLQKVLVLRIFLSELTKNYSLHSIFCRRQRKNCALASQSFGGADFGIGFTE